ncbi:MAG: hypothetical protein KFF77_08835, partial [Bacteroidetes bacterium]|nr:hypothetical protein [Bacteroidota bacterium]
LLTIGKDVGWVYGLLGGAIDMLLDPLAVELLMLAVVLLTVYTGVQYVVENRSFISTIFMRQKQVTE